jgi:hypothetical protein
VKRTAALAAGIGGLGLLLGAWLDPARTAFAYLIAFCFCTTLAVGLLTWVVVHHLTDSTWFLVVRRFAELGASTLAVLLVLSLPLLLSADRLYPWWNPAPSGALHSGLARTSVYLNPGFFVLRTLLYFGVWLATALLLLRWSIRQPDGPGAALARRQRILSAAAVVPLGFATYFAAVDWLMTLQPRWASSAFGVYVFAGGMVDSLSLLAVIAWLVERRRAPDVCLKPAHFHALGKLLLASLCFWAYIGFFQFLIVWIANVPAEVRWYVPRLEGAWEGWAVGLALLHFALPFGALLSRSLKRSAGRLALVAGLLLFAHAADLYWLALPALGRPGVLPHWVDLAAFAFVGGATLAFGLGAATRLPLFAHGDPRFEASLEFETG